MLGAGCGGRAGRAREGEYLQPLVSAENALLPLELLACEKKAPDKN